MCIRDSKKTKEGLRRTREAWQERISAVFDRPQFDEGLWEELEEVLIAGDVGVATSLKLVERTRERVRQERLKDAAAVRGAMAQEMVRILGEGPPPFALREGRPAVLLVVGVNGTGKTTSIAKLAHHFVRGGRSVVVAACDTFRAAAAEQLEKWCDRIQERAPNDVFCRLVRAQPGADPAAVAYDAIEAARARRAHVVIVDTAGRLHTKTPLMEELRKIVRVIGNRIPGAPHESIIVMDATTGQNGLTQARYFTEAVNVTGIFLAKLDGTAKGGIVLAICDDLKIPIKYIGTGETLEDMAPFDAEAFVEALCS